MEDLELTSLLKIQLGLSKPNPMPYNLHMVDQTIAKPFGLIRDLKIFVHGIPYTITFILINSNVLDYSYSMLLGRPWLRDAKVSHDWGTNTTTIQGISIVRTIPITNKLGMETKKPNIVIRYDFHFGIFDDEEDVMFATKLDMRSIRTITIPTHTKHVPKLVCILDTIMAELILKQLVVPINVLAVKLVIPPNIVKQNLPKTFFHLEVGEMIVDETHA